MENIETLVIFGATGDLTSRLLIPGLGRLLTEQPDRRISLIGTGRSAQDGEQWSRTVKGALDTVDAHGPAVDHLVAHTEYRVTDTSSAADLEQLLNALTGTPALYFALPPAVTTEAIEVLQQVELPENTMLVLEKPFGVDQQSAAELNRRLTDLVPENQIFRVDHFMGESTVLNLLGLRFTNRLFEPLWNREHIAKVEIVYDEVLGLEGRAGYYDRAGALVDMIQSHLLQVMALVTMEAPLSVHADDLRTAKTTALHAVRPFAGDPARASRRARYTKGTVEDRALPSYVDEDGVDPARETETLAEVTLESATWRWSGVPFILRSGKALGEPRQEIIITFRDVPHVPAGLTGESRPTVLRISLDAVGMAVEMNVTGPGNPFAIERATLSAEFGAGQLDPYGEVLNGVLNRDPTLSIRADAAEQAWKIIDEIRAQWGTGEVPLAEYPAGSAGPADWE